MGSPSDEPKRHPRLYTGDAAAALASLLRADPVFSVRLPADKISVVFCFEVPVPNQIPFEFRELYEVLFAGGRRHWERALLSAYENAKSGKKNISDYIRIFLHQVLKDAFEIWLSESWSLPLGTAYESQRETQLESFETQARPRKGPPLDPVKALLAAVRFHELEREVRALFQLARSKYGRTPGKKEWISAIRKSGLPSQLIESALRKIFPGSDQIHFTELSTPGLRPLRIAKEMLWVELNDKGYNLSTFTLDTYIERGDQLFRGLATLGK